jgi:alanine racemase
VTFGARALIRLGALEHNLEVLRSAAPDARIMAVIKANAYGHGMVAVAQHLEAADAFAVARLPEAQLLRQSGIDKPIVLLAGIATDEELPIAFSENFELVVHDIEQVKMLERAKGNGGTVWLKFDTGMNRLGFPPEAAPQLLPRLEAAGAVRELRLMTHFASADELDNVATESQLEAFKPVTRDFPGAVSIANSPASLGWPQVIDARAHLGFGGDFWIRPGIALYGISPFADRTGTELGLKPVMQFEARLIAVKPLSAGARVGYKGAYISDKDTTLGIVAAGYGDGYTRHFRCDGHGCCRPRGSGNGPGRRYRNAMGRRSPRRRGRAVGGCYPLRIGMRRHESRGQRNRAVAAVVSAGARHGARSRFQNRSYRKPMVSWQRIPS